MSFLVDGELTSRTKTTAMAFSHLRGGGLDMRHRLPDLFSQFGGIVLRSMPTAS
jgi:hypothetical protein